MSIKNKVLLINNGYPSKNNPKYTAYIKTIKECLQECNFEVELLVMNTSKSSVFAKLYEYCKYYLKLFAKGNLHTYKWIYINNYPYSFLPLSFRLKYLKNVIVHWHGQDILIDSKVKRILNKVSYFFLPKIAIHIAPSSYFAYEVSKKIGVSVTKVLISPSGGVDLNVFKSVYKKKPKDKFRLGFASGISNSKGFELIFKCIENVAAFKTTTYLPIEFHIINYGDDKNTYLPLISNYSNVVLYEQFEKDMMPTFYADIDILLFPTKADSLGLVALESMACGVPVVGTNDFALKEIIENGVSGEKFEQASFEGLVDATNKIIKNYELYNAGVNILGKWDRETVIENYKKYLC